MKKLSIAVTLVVVCVLANSGYAVSDFFSGKDWKELDKYYDTVQDRNRFKEIILKAAFEATVFTGNPVFEPEEDGIDIRGYVEIVDLFYDSPENESIPLVFALKAADIIRSAGVQIPDAQFEAAIREELARRGVL